jgi:hypothetical protein
MLARDPIQGSDVPKIPAIATIEGHAASSEAKCRRGAVVLDPKEINE